MTLLIVSVFILAFTILILMGWMWRLYQLIKVNQEDSVKILTAHIKSIKDLNGLVAEAIQDVLLVKAKIEDLQPKMPVTSTKQSSRPANRKPRTEEQRRLASEQRKQWWAEHKKKDGKVTLPISIPMPEALQSE